ncbi:MAG TPA: hypothetical protein VEB21_20210 [Terriglobales bacterium]|nr:hypothetical protein [Terriglobales bacterium]
MPRPPQTRSHLATYLPLGIGALVLAGLVAALIFSDYRPDPPGATPPTVAAIPSDTSAPVAAPVAQQEDPPLFDAWVQYEPAELREDANLRRRYVDAVLAHRVFQIPPSGLPPMQAQELLLEDDDLLLSSGRQLWTRELEDKPGFHGKICYVHSNYCLPELFDVQFFVDGKPGIIYSDQYRIDRFPSHTLTTYFVGGAMIEERKFITWDDRAVATYTARAYDNGKHQVAIEVTAPYPAVPRSTGKAAFPLVGSGKYQEKPLYLYLDAPQFELAPTAMIHLRRDLGTVDAGSSAQARVAFSYTNEPRPKQHDPAEVLPADVFEQHRRTYNQWFADNIPYFDSSDIGFKKMWYYRWWVVRFNLNELDSPDLKSYNFYEGKLGFDNVISFAVPVQLKELAYLRDPIFGVSQALNSYNNRSDIGAVVDPPGSPYWGEMYSHWIAAALAELNRVHPMDRDTLANLTASAALDVDAWATNFDQDNDGLPARLKPRLTGYDLDILSFWYFDGLKLNPRARLSEMERVDFASFVYANAKGVAELAAALGDQPLRERQDATASKIRAAVLGTLWDEQTKFFYPQRAGDDARAPIRELHGFFPFTMRLAPDEPRYTAALAKFIDPEEFWTRFPPVITSSYHYRQWNWEMDGLTRNIAPHPITMGAKTLLEAYKHYESSPIEASHFMELMSRYNELVYPGVHPADPYWRPNAHEYFSKWEPYQSAERPKPSDISHDFHSAYCYLVVEGAVGLTPRTDERIELDPAARSWDYFLLDQLRYRGHDLRIVWDKPDGTVRYTGLPEGFSLYIDGQLAFTEPALSHVIYDPEKREIHKPQ